MTLEANRHVLRFDGEKTFIRLGPARELGIGRNDFTVEAWIRAEDIPVNGEIAVLGSQSSGSDIRFCIQNQRLAAGFGDNVQSGTGSMGTMLGGQTPLAPGAWYHIAWRYTHGDQSQALFVNGILDKERLSSGALNRDQVTLVLGQNQNRAHFKGFIAEFRIWSRARSEAEIQRDMHQRRLGDEAGLAAYWPLNEGEGDRANDAIRYARDAAIEAPIWTETDKGTALRFNGTNSYAEVKDSADLAFGKRSPFSISGWVFPREKGGMILSKLNWDQQRNYFLIITPGRHLYFHRQTGEKGLSSGKTRLDFDRWSHVAGTYDGQFMRVFIDGQEVASRQSGPIIEETDTSTPVLIGAGFNHDLPDFFFNGTMKALAIWDRALGAEEIHGLMSGMNGKEPGLAGYWPLNEGDGDKAHDARLLRNPGAITAPDWRRSDPPVRRAEAEEPERLVAQFDGIADSATVSYNPDLDFSEAITVEAWVRPAQSSGELSNGPVASKHGTQAGWELRCGRGQAGFLVTLNGVEHQAISDIDLLNRDQWYHLAGVYDGEAIRLYVNGTLQHDYGVSGPISSHRGDLNIGYTPYRNRFFSGRIAEVRVWSRARAQFEIQGTLFEAPDDAAPGLAGYWPLDEGSGEQCLDLSPNHHHASLKGVEWVGSDSPWQTRAHALMEKDLRKELRSLRLKRNELAETLGKSQGELETLKVQYENLSKKSSQLQQDLDRLKQEKKELLAKHQQKIADLETEYKRKLQEELDAQRKAGISMADLINNANEQIKTARKQLDASDSTHRLGEVTMELRMIPAPSGSSMSFPEPEQLKDVSANLSTIQLDFTPRESAEEKKTRPVPVPNTIGYTELMARRKLSEAGFLSQVNYQAVVVPDDGPPPTDRVVNQYPKAEKLAEPNSTVTIFIGKAS